MPNPFEVNEETLGGCSMHWRLEDNGLSCIMLNNIGSLITLLILGVFIKLVLVVIRRVMICFGMNRRPNKGNRSFGYGFYVFIQVIYKEFNWYQLLNFVLAIQIDTFFGLAVIIRTIKLQYFIEWIDLAFSIAMLLKYMLIFGLFGFLSVHLYAAHKSKARDLMNGYKKVLPPFIQFLEEVKETSNTPYLDFMSGLVRDYIMPFVLVIFIEEGGIQLLTLGFFSITRLVYIVLVQPMKKNRDNYSHIVTEVLYTIVFILYCVILFMGGDELSEKTLYFFIGMPIVIALLFVVGLNVIDIVWHMIA